MEEAKKMEKWVGRIQPYTGIKISSHLKVYQTQSERPGSENWKRQFAVNFVIFFLILEILPLNQ